jgi:hypothetical protein
MAQSKRSLEEDFGICVMCEQHFKDCLCDPCQHDKTQSRECVFCERIEKETEHAI